MKASLLKSSWLFILSFASLSSFCFGQNWTQKAGMSSAGRWAASAFSIGHFGYICGGGTPSSNLYDLWKWDQTTNTWTQLANYPGVSTIAQCGFAIGGKGYVGLGGRSVIASDFGAYDTTSNSWSSKANFPGTARYSAFGFSVGTNGYIGCGSSGGPPYLNDVWKYNSITNTWTTLNNFPGGGREGFAWFTIGNEGFIGTGWDGTNLHNDFWQYNPSNDSWTTLPAIPVTGNGMGGTAGFAIGADGYICSGMDGSSTKMRNCWKLDTVTRTWTTVTTFGGVCRGYQVGFSINGKGYIGTGIDSLGNYLSDLWEYAPAIATGINEKPKNICQVSFYPNPVRDLIHFKLDGLLFEVGQLTINDMQGRLVQSITLNGLSDQLTIDGSSFKNGVYFYQIISGGKMLASGKIMKAN